MKDYLEPIVTKTELVMDKIMHRAEQGLDAFMHVPRIVTKTMILVIASTFDRVHNLANHETELAKALRYISLPWSLFIPKGYKYFFTDHSRALLFTQGVHMIRAKVGGGKSLTSFILAEIYLEETGYGSYFTSPVEKPQVTEDGELLYVHHRLINLNNYYDKGKKVRDYNTTKYKIMHKDERILQYPPRNNKSTAYNERFIPEHLDELLMRHKGLLRIYKYSQHPKLDSMEMETITYMHEVETKKDIQVKNWLASGKFNYVPIMLKFSTYILEYNFGDSKLRRKKVGSCKIPVPFELLQRFDTHAERLRNTGLPVDFN